MGFDLAGFDLGGQEEYQCLADETVAAGTCYAPNGVKLGVAGFAKEPHLKQSLQPMKRKVMASTAILNSYSPLKRPREPSPTATLNNLPSMPW